MVTMATLVFILIILLLPPVWSRPQDIQLHIGDSHHNNPLHLSYRCYMRPSNSREKNQIYGIKGCVDGQVCVPDNFYCFFYACPSSIGWCVNAHGNEAPKTHPTPTSEPSNMRDQPFGSDDL
uniref:Uncharacterized protein n=1 Tax=Plectus sambesii TaxID=2011161 RepID=A0A914WM05_9BILA